MRTINVLVSGWFSFEKMGTTAGDLIACNVVCDWLRNFKINFDVASKQSTLKGISWETSVPEKYTHVIFVCGPFGNGWPLTEFLDYYKNSKLIGLNLSIIQSLQEWNPFDFLIERDSELHNNPDITFGAQLQKAPVVGIIRAHKQKEYGDRAMHEIADRLITELINSHEMAIVNIDTSIENNQWGLRTSQEIESLIAKTDLVITTRLHGMVLALKNGIPALAIDPISGGAKLTLQAISVNWPYCFSVDEVSIQDLLKAFDDCLTEKAVFQVLQSTNHGMSKVAEVKNKVKDYLFNSYQRSI